MTGEQSTFESLAELIGRAGALNLCEQYGGTTLYVKKTQNDNEGLRKHWAEYFGPDALNTIAEKLGGKRVYIPAAPPEFLAERSVAIFTRMNDGHEVAAIARDFQLTDRSVRLIYARHQMNGGA